MSQNTRFRINVNTGDFEIEGSQVFVEKYLHKLPEIIESLRLTPTTVERAPAAKSAGRPALKKTVAKKAAPPRPAVKKPGPKRGASKKRAQKKAIKIENGEKFEQWLRQFHGASSQNDHVLLSGYYIQNNSKSKSFTSSVANVLLQSRGIKITNISNCLAQLTQAKKVEKVGTEGRSVVFRISAVGERYIESLQKKK